MPYGEAMDCLGAMAYCKGDKYFLFATTLWKIKISQITRNSLALLFRHDNRSVQEDKPRLVLCNESFHDT